MDKYVKGQWVLYRGQFIACVHGATKAGRYLIEYESPSKPNYINREWVKPKSIALLDEAVVIWNKKLAKVHRP